MAFLSLPNELLLDLAGNLGVEDLYALIRANRRLANLLLPLLHHLGAQERGLNTSTALCWAAYYGYEGLVQSLLDKGVHIDGLGLYVGLIIGTKSARVQGNALYWATEDRHNAVARVFSEMEPGTGALSWDQQVRMTPIFWAVIGGHETVVKLLIERGATFGQPAFGKSLLHDAVRGGHVGVARVLLENGFDPDSVERPRHWYWNVPIHTAVIRGDEAMLGLLLDKGAKIDARDQKGAYTALHCAAGGGNLAVMRQLLERGADIEATEGVWGGTPLHVAAYSGQGEAVEFLLGRGADISARTDAGDTILHNLTRNFTQLKMLKLLLAEGADANLKNSNGNTPLHQLVTYGYVSGGSHEAIAVLSEGGADIFARDKEGRSVLRCAEEQRDGIKIGILLGFFGYGVENPAKRISTYSGSSRFSRYLYERMWTANGRSHPLSHFVLSWSILWARFVSLIQYVPFRSGNKQL